MQRLLVMSRNRPAIRFLALAIFALGLGSCGEAPLSPQPEYEATGEISVAIRMGKVAAANISWAEIVVTVSGIDYLKKQRLTVSGDTIRGIVTGIPVGSARFTLNGYNASDTLTYTGSATATVTAGQSVTVNIPVRRVGAAPTGTPQIQVGGVASANRLSYSTEVTMEVSNTGTADATNTIIKLRARGSSGAAVADAEANIGTIRQGDSRLVTVTFDGTDNLSFESKYIYTADYTLTYKEGGPKTGTITIQ